MTTSVYDIRKENCPHGALMIFDRGRHVATRFRIWSPSYIPLLYLPDMPGEPLHQMEDCGPDDTGMRAGWSELILPAAQAPANSRYFYGFPRQDDEQDFHFVPDFASFGLEKDVYSASLVTDLRHRWRAESWKGIAWHKARLLSLHIGTDTREGNFLSLIEQLDDIKDRGFNVIEPLNFGAFAGERGWGFDCVQPMVPHPSYGTLQDLMSLIDACHERGIGFSTQLIQNHLGDMGNYLKLYAPDFFKSGRGDWGDVIHFAHPDVRSFFLQTARLYADTCRSDMFRFDAAHAIEDPSEPHILKELHDDIQMIAHAHKRPITIIHEFQYDRNFARLGEPSNPTVHARANWADSLNHAAKCAIAGTGFDIAYFRPFFRAPGADFSSAPDTRRAVEALAEAIALGGYNVKFGDPHRKDGIEAVAGEIQPDPLRALTQLGTHDQQGNTVDGMSPFEKILKKDTEYGLLRYKQFIGLMLLQPGVPMVWNHFGRPAPFPFFHGYTDPEVAEAILAGRRRELARAGYDEVDIGRDMIAPHEKSQSYDPAKLFNAQGMEIAPVDPAIDGFIRNALRYREEYIEPLLDLQNHDRYERPDIQILGDYEGLDIKWIIGGGEHAMAFNFCAKEIQRANGHVLAPYNMDVKTTPGMHYLYILKTGAMPALTPQP